MQIAKLLAFMSGCGESEREIEREKSLLFNAIQITNVPAKQQDVVNLDKKEESLKFLVLSRGMCRKQKEENKTKINNWACPVSRHVEVKLCAKTVN